jgi:hypothetical protein
MKSKPKALALNRETVRELDARDLEKAAGGQITLIGCPISITACDCTGNYTYQGC